MEIQMLFYIDKAGKGNGSNEHNSYLKRSRSAISLYMSIVKPLMLALMSLLSKTNYYQ